MPWHDEFSFDPYAGAPDPFGPQPPPDQFAMPQSWRDIVANAPDQPPAPPMPDPLGLPPGALEGVGAALPPMDGTPESGYRTPLSSDAESEFQTWVRKNKIPYRDEDQADYDMRGFWLAQKSGDPRASTAVSGADGQPHFPDTWKTPSHATLSNESIYAPPDAPAWHGNVLIGGDGRVVADERTDDERAAIGLPPFAPPLDDAPPPSFFGAPLAAPITPVDLAKGIVEQGIGEAPPEPEIEMAPEYANPLGDPNLDDAGLANELVDIARRDPARYARIKAMEARAEDVEFRTRELEAKERNYQTAEENARIRRQAVEDSQREIDEIRVERKALANSKVDNDAWFKSRSVPQKISAVLAAVIGGLIQGRVGGRNTGLDMVLKMADDHVETQKFNLQQQRGDLAQREQAAGQRRAGADQLYRDSETLRMATLERIANQIATERGKYNPKNKAAIALADLELGIQSEIAKADQAYQDQALDKGMKVGRYNLDVRKQNEEERKNRADEEAKAAKARLAAGAGAAANKTKLTPDELRASLPPGAWIPPAGSPAMTLKEYGERAEAAVKGLKVSSDIPATGRSKEQLERTVPYLKMPDGSDFVATAGDITEIKELRGAGPETEIVVKSIDAMIRLIDENGHEPDFLKSKAWQQAKAHWSNAVLTSKSPSMFALGVLTGPDVGILGQVIGTDDPTQLRDTTEGLKTGRANIIGRFQGKAKGLGYPGDVNRLFPFVDPKRKPKSTDEDKAYQTAQSAPKVVDPRVGAELTRLRGEGLEPPGLGVPKDFLNRVIMPDVRKSLSDLENVAMQFGSGSPDLAAQAKNALERLEDLSRTGGNDAVKAAALDAAQKVRQASVPVLRPERPR